MGGALCWAREYQESSGVLSPCSNADAARIRERVIVQGALLNPGDAALAEETGIERVRQGPRGDDPGVAPLRARAHPRRGDRRRSRPGHVGAGAARRAFVSWTR